MVAPFTTPFRSGRWNAGPAPSFTSRSSMRDGGDDPIDDTVDDPVASSALERQLLEVFVRVEPVDGGNFLPGAVRTKAPGQDIVCEQYLEDLRQARRELGVGDRHHRLDAPVQVSLHHVRGPKVVLRFGATKREHPRMLEESANYRTNPDALRESRHTRPNGAHPPHAQSALLAHLGRCVERVDDLGVDEAVDLDEDAAADHGLPFHVLLDPGPQAPRSHDQLSVEGLPG